MFGFLKMGLTFLKQLYGIWQRLVRTQQLAPFSISFSTETISDKKADSVGHKVSLSFHHESEPLLHASEESIHVARVGYDDPPLGLRVPPQLLNGPWGALHYSTLQNAPRVLDGAEVRTAGGPGHHSPQKPPCEEGGNGCAAMCGRVVLCHSKGRKGRDGRDRSGQGMPRSGRVGEGKECTR